MKLAPLLASYLSTNKRLALRGIGVFESSPSAYVDTTYSKNSKLPTEDISFTNDPATGNDEEFIKFISAQTGKMKALAMSDFDSYLELMQQFLNIGKPFMLDGIGTLVKLKQGLYEFTAGQQLNERMADTTVKEAASTTNDSLKEFKQFFPKQQSHAGLTLKKSFFAFLLFGGIVFAIWGGYTLYSRGLSTSAQDAKDKTIVPVEEVAAATVVKLDEDTVKKVPPTRPPGYKFVFETTHSKKRAINRFNILKKINSDIHLETADSSLFNITVNLNIPATDTTRVKDSLNVWYYGKRDMLVKIASPNTSANVP